MAALAATKGPEAIAVAMITGELAVADPDFAIHRLIRFLASAERVFERVGDSMGHLQEVYHDAAAAIPDLFGQLDETGKASIHGRLLIFAISDDHGFF